METPTPTSSHFGVRERWLTTALLGLGLITFAIDASNTQLILPQVMTSLRVELYEIHWILTAPGIARTVVIAATGWLIGWWGPRTLYLICIGSMAIGSLGSMLAWDWPSLIFFRILAGVGGGMIPQLSQAIFYQIFPPGQRGMALGFALMGWSIGPAFGPLVDLRLFGSVPFVMAMVVMFLTTMTLRGTGPMFAVLMQRLLGFGPLLVAWAQMPPNLIYGVGVLLVGRLSDRLPTYVLVISGLL